MTPPRERAAPSVRAAWRAVSSRAGAPARRWRNSSRLPAGPGRGDGQTPPTPSPSSWPASATARTAAAPGRRVADHPAAADRLPAGLELGLDQQHQVAVVAGQPGQDGQDQAQRDERQVGHGQVDRPADLGGLQRAHVGPVQHPDPRVLAQAEVELAVADVDGHHLGRPGLQQHVGEAAGGGAGVEAAPPGHRHAEPLEGRGQLVAAAAGPAPGRAGQGERVGGGDQRRRLGRDRAGDQDPPVPDGRGGRLPAGRQTAPDQLAVQPHPGRHRAPTAPRGAGARPGWRC